MKKILLSFTTISALTLSMFSNAYSEEYIVKMISKGDKGTYYFEPKDITVKSGDTITWVNIQDDMHNAVTSSVPKGAESFEGPMLLKKGQKWSYTLKKSGTYNYHCHPHAAFGMVGIITVDRPSKPEEIQDGDSGKHSHGSKMKGMDHGKMKGMDHDKMKGMDHDKMGKGLTLGKGVVNSVDAKNNKINITHEPIPALKWSAMTMDFVVSKKVNLSNIKSGDNVTFYIKLGRDKVYRIAKILPAAILDKGVTDEHGNNHGGNTH